ncbi:50S ribosomal protein L9 [Rufibacter glacialis]|uniref:Large ribosomal subunit protein bL9 n=1 Tax=Rufibacter glacialis TaxID=1259555 RepID=A0A5M8QLN5_9BACT|nr:50S ribosomal protein L9 [Rufibacter glacialis]KAA6435874.1 50S ribosomal protein L9 [Rufibacter glacialis]GGK67310.1 50S ribosomal protein L9 [Rufibacter glacialis]
MEVILKDDVKGVGYKNDIVSVKPGFGRNYLIPQGLAEMATPSARKVVAENTRQAAHKAEKIQKDAQELANRIGDTLLEIPAKAGESGKIFGAVTTLQVSEALKALGYEVDRKRIDFDQEVKSLGEYTATINLHKEVKHQVRFNVVAA